MSYRNAAPEGLRVLPLTVIGVEALHGYGVIRPAIEQIIGPDGRFDGAKADVMDRLVRLIHGKGFSIAGGLRSARSQEPRDALATRENTNDEIPAQTKTQSNRRCKVLKRGDLALGGTVPRSRTRAAA